MKEKKQRKLPLGWIWLVLTLLTVIGAVAFQYYRESKVLDGFHHQVYEKEPSPSRQDQFRKFLTGLGVNLYAPATDGTELSFYVPETFTMNEFAGQTTKVRWREQLACDFVSWSGDHGRGIRYLTITYDGKTRQVSVPPKVAGNLYLAALKQNGLEDRFLQETGEKLRRGTARDALRSVDRQIFELGIYAPADYPFDRDGLRTSMGMAILLAPLGMLLLLMLLPDLLRYLEYRAWLSEYNREHQESWEQMAGELPQFVSLRESGERAVPVYRRPGFLERFKELFSPPVRK